MTWWCGYKAYGRGGVYVANRHRRDAARADEHQPHTVYLQPRYMCRGLRTLCLLDIPSGEYIEFMVSISKDGKIIDVMTTYQSESKGFGDVCATDEYTEQFRGAVAGDIVITEECNDTARHVEEGKAWLEKTFIEIRNM